MILPLVMSVTFAFFPAGLVLYWVTNTVLTIAQQWNINRRIAAAAAGARLDGAMRERDTIVARPRHRGGAAWRWCGSPGRRCRDIAHGTAGFAARSAPRHVRRAGMMPPASCIDIGLALYFPAPHSFTGEACAGTAGAWRRCRGRCAARAHRGTGRAPRAGRGVQRARLPQRQDRSRAGRSHRGSHGCRLASRRAGCHAFAAGRVHRSA